MSLNNPDTHSPPKVVKKPAVSPLQYLLILVFFKIVILFYILNYHF
jgi:hypothetical protein